MTPKKRSRKGSPRRVSPRKLLLATMSKVRQQLWKGKSDVKLKHCEVRLTKLSEEMIRGADIQMGEDWKKYVKITKELYILPPERENREQDPNLQHRQKKSAGDCSGVHRTGSLAQGQKIQQQRHVSRSEQREVPADETKAPRGSCVVECNLRLGSGPATSKSDVVSSNLIRFC